MSYNDTNKLFHFRSAALYLNGLTETPGQIPLEQIPKIELARIQNRSVIPSTHADGKGFLRLERGNVGTHEVFLKISTRTIEQIEREVYWLLYLNLHGFGPRFDGLTVIGEHYALVMEYVPGLHIQAGGKVFKLPKEFFPTQNLIDDIHRLRDFLIIHQIHPADLQLRITPNSAKVIDPEYFTFELESPNIAPYFDHLLAVLKGAM